MDRYTSCYVELDLYDTTANQDSTLSVDNVQTFCDIESIRKQTEINKIATLENNYFLLDGSFSFYDDYSGDNFGYMSKEYGFYNLLKVEEYYDLFLSLYKVGGRYRSRRIEEVLEILDMTQYKQVFIGELPIETFPFLYLGKAILQEPEWLLMDEPFDNMSVTARKKMIGILLGLHEKGTSMIINTSMYPEMMGFITDVVVIEGGKNLTFGPVEEVYAEALCKSPVRMHILAQMEKALEVLKENHLVDRVTVDGDDVIFRFNGGEKEEAELLTDLVASGALIHNYMRDQVNIEEIFRR